MRRTLITALLLFLAPAAFCATEGGAIPVPVPLFPTNNWWNTDVSAAPLDPNSTNFLTFIGLTKGLHPDFGGDVGDGTVYGFPFILVNGSQAKKTVLFDTPEESDGVDHATETSVPFYPVPDEAITMNGWIEEGAPGNIDARGDSDRHMLMVDTTNNTLYELYAVFYNGTNWTAGSGAFFDMNTNNRRQDTWTSADAAGLAILPGLIRYDEVFGPNEINHALRFTVRASNGYVYPASHNAGTASGALPMGARLRLKAGTNISAFTPEIQKIFRAFKKYGLIVADNGTDMYISGTYDTRWNNDVLNPAFGALKVSDFEVVQQGWKPSVSLVIALPAAMGAGDAADATVTAYDANYNVATGYRGTVHFTATDGTATLPLNYTFTSGDAGVHTFAHGVTLHTVGSQTVTLTDVADATINGFRIVVVGPPTPTGLMATAGTTTRVDLSWTSSAGATQYEVQRASAISSYATLTTTAATTYSDNTALANTTYVYKVCAIDASSRRSPFSIPDAATTILFSDDPLVPMTTVVKSAHVAELRQAVNAMRAAAHLTAATFTDSTLTTVKTVHVDELRAALAPARSGLGLAPVTVTDTSLTIGATIIKAAHLQELRDGVK